MKRKTSNKLYITKFAVGRHWWYVDTRKPHRLTRKVFGRWVIVVSYRKAKMP